MDIKGFEFTIRCDNYYIFEFKKAISSLDKIRAKGTVLSNYNKVIRETNIEPVRRFVKWGNVEFIVYPESQIIHMVSMWDFKTELNDSLAKPKILKNLMKDVNKDEILVIEGWISEGFRGGVQYTFDDIEGDFDKDKLTIYYQKDQRVKKMDAYIVGVQYDGHDASKIITLSNRNKMFDTRIHKWDGDKIVTEIIPARFVPEGPAEALKRIMQEAWEEAQQGTIQDVLDLCKKK